MNGAHDLGGLEMLGPINPEPEESEPTFHAQWEQRVFAMTLAAGMLGQWNLDQSRFARERQRPVDYLRNSYYENWLAGLLTLLEENGLIDRQELESGKAKDPIAKAVLERVPDAARVATILATGGPVDMATEEAPRFQVGDRVSVRNDNPKGHTRMPRYVRGHTGRVGIHHGCHIFADDNARGQRRGQHLYNVEFTASDIWPNRAGTIHVDLWQDHLDAAR